MSTKTEHTAISYYNGRSWRQRKICVYIIVLIMHRHHAWLACLSFICAYVFFPQYLPIVWALIERKTTEAYVAVLHHFKTVLAPHLRPTSFMMDFERGLTTALQIIYPQATIGHCYFHHCQVCKFKKTSKTNFTISYGKFNFPIFRGDFDFFNTYGWNKYDEIMKNSNANYTFAIGYIIFPSVMCGTIARRIQPKNFNSKSA